MKTAVIVMTLLLFFASAHSQQPGEKKIPVLNDASDSAWKNPAMHRDFDVEVARFEKFLNDTTNLYWITTYRTSAQGKLEHDMFGFEVEAGDRNYDVAFYKWLNDSTVAVRLYDSASTKEQKLTKGRNWMRKE